MYVAKSWVDTGKRMYSPGEVIERDYPGAQWHLKIGAIRALKPVTEPERPAAEEAPTPIGAGTEPEPEETEEDVITIDVTEGLVTSAPEEKKAKEAKTGRTRKKGGKTDEGH